MPTVELEVGLRRTIAYFRERLGTDSVGIADGDPTPFEPTLVSMSVGRSRGQNVRSLQSNRPHVRQIKASVLDKTTTLPQTFALAARVA